MLAQVSQRPCRMRPATTAAMAKWFSTRTFGLALIRNGRPQVSRAGDGVQFWLEAEQELVEGTKEKFVQGDGWHEERELETREAEENVKAGNASADSHYRDNNRMFQSHGERGHRHGDSR